MARNTAFEILYADYYPRVFGLCRRLLSSEERAEDATQETFMRAYRNFNRYDAQRPFWQWIATIANNHCLDLLRHENRTNALFGDETEEIEQIADAQAPMLGELISEQRSDAVNDAIARLDARYRVVLVLAYFNQLSYEQIAEQLSISRNHVGVLLLRAKQRLRAELSSISPEADAS